MISITAHTDANLLSLLLLQASVVDSWSVDDVIDSDKVMRQVAEQNLGPLLATLGVDEDPLTFFYDLFKFACALQLATAGVLFYSCELGLGFDVGDSFRVVFGLLLGYFLRVFIHIDTLVSTTINCTHQLQ